MDLSAKILGIRYTPLLCKKLEEVSYKELKHSFEKYSAFILNIDNSNKVAISWWVSAKRTRSYPYARVYDTLQFSGKKITIIPIIKDEGIEGDRDFLQWDTISLMSLLGVYVIIGYYVEAVKSKRYSQKITNQRFDIKYISEKINEIVSYHSDALHWNLKQLENVGDIFIRAIESYKHISNITNVRMHSFDTANKRIKQLIKGKEEFMNLSRSLAKSAQKRESMTVQPKENLSGEKGTITIKNFLGGLYYFTVDEIEIIQNKVYLIECKHSKGRLPSIDDIKDGLIKMILFTNLEEVRVNDKKLKPIPTLKLTIKNNFDYNRLTSSQKDIYNLLNEEAKINKFLLKIL
jgi:hypothetical protein